MQVTPLPLGRQQDPERVLLAGRPILRRLRRIPRVNHAQLLGDPAVRRHGAGSLGSAVSRLLCGPKPGSRARDPRCQRRILQQRQGLFVRQLRIHGRRLYLRGCCSPQTAVRWFGGCHQSLDRRTLDGPVHDSNRRCGTAVQVDPAKPTLKAPESQRERERERERESHTLPRG